jgi:hypothetical protein
MKNSLPRLALLLMLLCVAAFVALRHRTGAANEPTEGASDDAAALAGSLAEAEDRQPAGSAGDKLIVQSAAMLDRRTSVSARLRHQIHLGRDALYGLGSYWQQGSGTDLRVRWEMQIAGQESSLKQVSNSRFLWTDRQLPTGRSVTRVDLRQLRADQYLGDSPLDGLEPGRANWSTAQPEFSVHGGGLPSLLASLSENFSFLPPQAMRLAAQTAAESASIPVFAVVGHWKHARLAALLARGDEPDDGDAQPESIPDSVSMVHSLPQRLPQEVLVLVGQADLFPYRIEYRRLETPATSGSPAPYQLSEKPLVVLELTDVAFDVPIAAGQFDFAPGDADWTDQTPMVLDRMRRQRERQLAARAKADGQSAR